MITSVDICAQRLTPPVLKRNDWKVTPMTESLNDSDGNFTTMVRPRSFLTVQSAWTVQFPLPRRIDREHSHARYAPANSPAGTSPKEIIMRTPIQLVGATASPYTQKMVALLRYRRLPYAVTWGDPGTRCDALGIERPRPALMPTFFLDYENGVRAVCDSTPIVRILEAEHPARSVLPDHPALVFIDYLVEDFADEWCTKYMFHYRWHGQADADNAGTLLPLTTDISMSAETLAHAKKLFSQRQIGRLYVVGSNEVTAPLIDASYRRFLAAMEDLLSSQRFVLGNRPGAGDFGLYGQLSQLVGFDPTPRAIAHEISPRTVAWVDLLRDLSGLEPEDGDWATLEALAPAIRGLLSEIGRVYAPAQLANARAFSRGEETWETEIDGTTWTQPTFPYQVKCLNWTKQAYLALSNEDRSQVDRILEGTGADAMFLGD